MTALTDRMRAAAERARAERPSILPPVSRSEHERNREELRRLTAEMRARNERWKRMKEMHK